MQSVLSSLRTRLSLLFRQQNINAGTDTNSHLLSPLYQRTPPLWAQWTYALVACDVFMTSSAVEMTWNHWTEPAAPQADAALDANPQPARFVLRPIWQRLGLCVVHLGIGVGVAVALIGSHTRVVRTLCILPPRLQSSIKSNPKQDLRQVFLQCTHHWKNRGRIFPMSSCRLHPGRDDTELILRVDGQRGHWWLGLNKAKISGKNMSLAASRSTILGEWKQQRNTGWKSGPVLDRKI